MSGTDSWTWTQRGTCLPVRWLCNEHARSSHRTRAVQQSSRAREPRESSCGKRRRGSCQLRYCYKLA
eukprot:1765981-Rhodomonas_salina.2